MALRRSLSDSLLLEDDNVSVEGLEYTDLHLHEDDEIVGASGRFELQRNEQKKNEAVDILKLIDNDKGITKHGLKSSKSLESLDIKAPNEVWKDSYDKLFNAKVKKYMKGNKTVKENRHGIHNGPVTTQTLDRKSCQVNVSALLENADRMRLNPYETEFDNQVGPFMVNYDSKDSTGEYDSEMLVQGSDLLRSAKIKTSISRDVPLHHSTKNLTSVEREINIHGGTYTDPKIDVGINAPDSNLTLSNTQGSPVMHLTKGHFKGPKAVLNSSDMDMDVPSVNAKKPKFKLPKFSLSGNKNTDISYDGSMKGSKLAYPEVAAGFNGSDIQIDGPKADFKGLKTDLPDMEMSSGKLKTPTFSMPNFDLSGPKIKTPDYDLSTPKFKTDFDSPDINIRGHKPDITGPDMDVDIPAGTFKGPNFKKPNLTLPQTDVKGPNLDIKSPDIDVNGPSGKLNMPELKMPSFGVSGLKGPHMNMDADIDKPDLNLSASTPKLNAGINSPDIDIHGPNVDLKGPKTDLTLPDMNMPSGKMKVPTFKMPDFGLSGPKIKTPEYDLKTPEMDLSAPKFKADFDSPDITTPDLNVDIPKGKMKGLNFKKPHLDVNAPDLDINAPSGKLKLPKFGISGSKPKGPDLKYHRQKPPDTPTWILNIPQTDLKRPEPSQK
ncbi:neuroblast differentiation-associated protein AHNAK-like [Cyprinus carpio]|uniref:Neuroblast differentiation-associated protein AHNAK-like n=1 Tax=Cyprinus carpio TaxID=7962 RepID=A0A9R0AA71_CYPCA|nr:neuroblast differentiation-associated protein AHNAK-like [Cyprinus carpio]